MDSPKRFHLILSFFFLLFFLPSTKLMAQWQTCNTNTTQNLYAIDSDLGTRIASCGNGITIFSENYGNTWTTLNSFLVPSDSVVYKRSKFRSILVIGPNNIYVAGHDSITGNGVIFQYTMAPTNAWSLSYNQPGGKILAMNAFGPNIIAVGENGICKRLQNNIWVPLPGSWGTAHLTDITKNYTNTTMYIPSSNGYIRAFNLSTETTQIYSCPQPIKELCFMGNTYTAMDANAIFSGFDSPFSSTFIQNTNYNGNIAPTSISNAYLATQSGLMKKVNSSWEYVISTYNTPINDLVTLENSPSGVACGNNGLVIRKTGFFDATYPYAGFSGNAGHCVGESAQFTPTGSLDYWYSWYVNGNLMSSSANDYFSYTFPSAGSYEVMTIGSNGNGLYDSATQTVIVVDVPSGNFSYTVSNPYICKLGDAEIVIHNAVPQYTYSLHRIDSPYLYMVNSATGTGNVTLHSGIIAEANQYKLSVRPSIAGCHVFHTDTVNIDLEQTKARFNPGIINAYTGETVTVYNTSREAYTFSWAVNMGGNFQNFGSSTGMAPFVTSFTDTGLKQIRLVAESIHGCTDTLTKTGLYVLNEVFNYDRCKVQVFKGNDNLLNLSEVDYVYDTELGSSGSTIFAGGYQDAIIPSKNGSLNPSLSQHGGYISKYDKHGVLKWLVYTQHSDLFYNNPFSHLESDRKGNLYAASGVYYQSDTLPLYDVTGEKRDYVYGTQQENMCVLSKFDSNGVFKWNMRSNAWQPEALKADTLGNIYVIFLRNNISAIEYITGPNNQIITSNIPSSSYIDKLLVKIDTLGNLYHMGSFLINSLYSGNYPTLNTDDAGNIYVTIDHNYSIGSYTISIVGNNGTVTPVANSSNQLLHCKFNTQGNLEWHTVIKGGWQTTVDHLGNSYLTAGQATNLTICKYNTQCVTYDPDCSFFFCKLDPQGDFLWNRKVKQYSSVAPHSIGVGRNTDEVYIIVSGLGHPNTPSTGPIYLSSGPQDSVLVSLSSSLPSGARDMLIARYDTAGILQDFNYENFAFGQPSYLSHRQIKVVDGEGIWATGSHKAVFPNSTIIDEYVDPAMGFCDGVAAFYTKDFCKTGELVPTLPEIVGCSGQTVSLTYTTDPTFPITPQTQYTLQLSGNTGSYANPTILQTQPAAAQNTFSFVLPSGNGQYTIRVVSDSPQGLGYPIPITIGNPSQGVDSSLVVCQYDEVLVPAQGPALNFVWQTTANITGNANGNLFQTDSVLSPGIVYCTKEALCGSAVDTFHINLYPIVPSFPTSSANICPGEKVLLPAVSSSPNHMYIWNHSDVYLNTTNHWVLQPSVSTQYLVYVQDQITNCSIIDSFYVNIQPAPTVTLSGDAGLLTCNASGNNLVYNWLLNDTLVHQGTESTYVPTQNGTYSVSVQHPDFICNGLSNTITLANVGMNDYAVLSSRLFPNPVTEKVAITGLPASSGLTLTLVETSGKVLQKTIYHGTSPNTPLQIDVSHLADGYYIILLKTDQGQRLHLPFVKKH